MLAICPMRNMVKTKQFRIQFHRNVGLCGITEVDFLCFASEFQKDGFLNVYKLRHICMSDIN